PRHLTSTLCPYTTLFRSVVEGETLGEPEAETDRARFLGRGRGIHAPSAMMDSRRLSNTVRAVLDPVFALRYRVRVPAGATVRIADRKSTRLNSSHVKISY